MLPSTHSETHVLISICTPQKAYPRFYDAILSTKYFDDESELAYFGYRYYSPEMGRWLNRDPLSDLAFLSMSRRGRSSAEQSDLVRQSRMPVYLFLANAGVTSVDPVGLTPLDLARHLLGLQIPKAVGFTAAGEVMAHVANYLTLVPSVAPFLGDFVSKAASAGLTSSLGITAGGGAVAMFFPDSCELAVFKVFAGIGNPATWTAIDPSSFTGPWYTGGILASAGGGIEFAKFHFDSTPGNANAASFVGVFHTGTLAVPGLGGATVYMGNPVPPGVWSGGTVTLGPGIGVTTCIDWKYEFWGGPWDLKVNWMTRCLCRGLILLTPPLP